ncbi:MAG TPA: DUF1015 family protein [Candidatus Bathyarchaeia archaeon]|nr:DUF1015 family protein [Candidatus Bathyarchaeia archaeon]
MDVRPFRGLRPRPDLASRIPSLPYDVLDSDEARKLAAGDAHTFLHVVKPEIDLDPAIDPHDERVYARGRANLDAMRDAGWLVRDARPAFYLYRLRMGSHVQTGIVGAAAVADYLAGKIKRHEHTRPDKEDDRTRHTQVLGAQPGPVFLAYRDRPDLDRIVTRQTGRPADAEFVAVDGVGHQLWAVDAPDDVAEIQAALSDVPASYIADGHHRAAAYARAAGSGGRFLAVHFPASQLRILDYNRLVKDLGGRTVAGFLLDAQAVGFAVVSPWEPKRPARKGTFGMYLDGAWRLLEASGSGGLDVSILQEKLLGPVLGVGDPRTDPRIAFVGGGRGVEELERRVDSGAYAVAFALFPTSLDEVMSVADAGEVMPPKSTWFEPKLRSGMVVRLADDA